MIVIAKYINTLREKSFMNISVATEQLILEKFSSGIEIDDDGHQHTYTEQDIMEQIRKMIC
jgi:hypothetical protein